MLFLKLLSAIASLFAIYPLLKFVRKDEINIFDLIILFHTIFYCFVPIVSDYSAFLWLKDFYFEDNIIFRIFIYYILTIFLILRIDLFWSTHYKYRKNIINITYYIRSFPQIEVSWAFLGILVVNLLISWIWYLPQASYFEAFDKFSQLQGYAFKSPLYLLYGAIFTLCFSFCLILFLKENTTRRKTNILLCTLLGFSLLLLFLPRRIMLFYLILSLLFVYSVRRNFFTKKSMIWIVIILFIILKIYFPFYNVMRNTNVNIDRNNFTTSLIHIIEDTNNRFESNKKHAAETSEGRALNLYYALYRIIKYDKSPSNGRLLIAAIDHATPKYINPNKGAGSSILLEKKMQIRTDQADSLLLLAYGDFGLVVGAFYASFLFVLIISLYVLLDKFSFIFLNWGSTIGILLIVYLISFAWNVEGALDSSFASLVHLTIISIILMLLHKFNIIGYKNVS